jgi:superfamily II DNA or RNA helicase
VPDSSCYASKVQGSARRPYQQTIFLELDRRGGLVVDGDCTCVVGHNCKHVAAVLLSLRDQQALLAPRAAPLRVKSPQHVQTAFELPQTPVRTLKPVLASALTGWLRELAADAEAESEDYPESVSKRLFYMLQPTVPMGQRVPILAVSLTAGDVRGNGELGGAAGTPQAQSLLNAHTPPKYLRPSDRAILPRLDGTGFSELLGDPADGLRQVLATGRGRLGAYPGTPARPGPPRGGELTWRVEDDGSQVPELTVAGGAAPVLLPAPWYVDSASGELGPVGIDLPPRVLRRLLNAPPIPPENASEMAEQLAVALPAARLPAPRVLPHGGTLGGVPVPHLHLRKMTAAAPYYNPMQNPGNAGMVLSFLYGKVLVPHDHAGGDLVRNGTRFSVQRDRAAEAAVETVLEGFGFRWLHRALPHYRAPGTKDRLVQLSRDPESDWFAFVLQGVPKLRADGWDIVIDTDFPHRLMAPTAPLQAELREGSGIDWFEFNLGVQVGDERIDLVGPLLALLRRYDAAEMMRELGDKDADPSRTMILGLSDGRRLALEMASIRPLLLTLFELFGAGGLDAAGDTIKVARHAAADMAALEEAGLAANLVWRGGEALRALGQQLRERGGIAAAKVPKWFTATLRPYQQRGVDWLQFLREAGLAGVLADDMGLGKTVQTLAHLAIEKQAGRLKQPALVVCPTSVVGNWAREAMRFAPRLRVLVLQGTDRKRLFSEIAESHVVISTYPLLSRDDDVLSQQHWHMLILDEAQTVKNPAATMAQTVRRLHANQRICLTGTPMENHLGELWALFDFMMPGFLGSQQDFGRRFRTPIEKGGDAELHASLAKRVAPFLLRRTKGEVASDLPPRTEIIETVQMQASQRAVYEAIRLAMHTRVQQAIAEQGLAKSGIVILDALLKMRQACCDPRLLKIATVTKHKAGSAKLDRLLELVTTLLEEGRAILLFSQFTSMLALIQESLGKLGIGYCLLTGETRDRASQIDAFQAGKKKLFLISLKAGGVGLNLTAADTVIHYDPWWNPAVENQATDRAHRIGQTKSVFVHRLITENTIEEKMEVLKARKSALAEGILTGAAANALKMTEADIDMLFG